MRRTNKQARAELESRYGTYLAKKQKKKTAFFRGGTTIAVFIVCLLLVTGLAIPSRENTSSANMSQEELSSVQDDMNASGDFTSNSTSSRGEELYEYVTGRNLMSGIIPMAVSKKTADDIFVRAQMEFAVELFKQSCLGQKSALVSPLSAQLCLAMVANGAAGGTLAEMEQVLGGGLSLEQLNEYLPAYTQGLPSTEKVLLNMSNAIWFREGYPIRKDFLQTNANYYGAELFQTAFGPSSVDEINQWVSDNTDGMIDKLFDDLPCDTITVLVNTLLFDGVWETAFDPNHFMNAPFYAYDGKEQSVTFMKSEENRYLSGENFDGFLKYYDGRDYAFAALLPDEGIDIFSFVQSLNGDKLLEILKNQFNVTANVWMPKFIFEGELDMKQSLSDMGMPSAFLQDVADFSRLGDTAFGNIFLQKLIQKTRIEVSESGTKAAAATGGVFVDSDSGHSVILNRPFVYMIIDSKTNLPLFLGVFAEIPA